MYITNSCPTSTQLEKLKLNFFIEISGKLFKTIISWKKKFKFGVKYGVMLDSAVLLV